MLLTLEMESPDGLGTLLIETLKSPAWIHENAADVGRVVWLELDEFQLKGLAHVIEARGPPAIASGDGCIVLSTFQRASDGLLKLELSSGESLRVTDTHRLYSASVDGWVAAGTIETGDYLRGADASIQVVGVDALPGEWAVFNVEVEGAHRYLVGEGAIVAHNNGSGGATGCTPSNNEDTLAQQQELARLTREAREELANDFDKLSRRLTRNQTSAVERHPWLLRVFFGTILEARVARKIRDAVTANPNHVLRNLTWTGRTNAPADFVTPSGFGFDITGNSAASIAKHTNRAGIDAVVTYDSLPTSFGYRFVRWLQGN